MAGRDDPNKPETSLAAQEGKRLVNIAEASDQPLNAVRVKSQSAQEPFSCRGLYEANREVQKTFTTIVTANTVTAPVGAFDPAVQRRMMMFVPRFTFKPDKELTDKGAIFKESAFDETAMREKPLLIKSSPWASCFCVWTSYANQSLPRILSR